MSTRLKSRPSKYVRSRSITDKLLEAEQKKSLVRWYTEPDEVTKFGNKRLIRSLLRPNTTVHDPRKPDDFDEKEEIYDLIASVLVDLLQEVSELYRRFLEEHEVWAKLLNSPKNYKNEGFPSKKKYTWPYKIQNKVNGEFEVKEVEVNVDKYVQNVLEYVTKQIDNPKVFPEDEAPFNDHFPSDAKELNTLLFRIMAIMFSNEHESVLCMSAALKKTLRKQLYFSYLYDLLDEKELDCIYLITDPISEQYELDYANLEEDK